MDIRGLIKEFEESEKKKEEILKGLKLLFLNEPELWFKLENLNMDVLTTEKAMSFIADSLQLVSDENRLEFFNLQEVKRIYQILVKYNPYNLQYQSDLIAFVNNVLGDEKEAQSLAENAIKLMEKKRLELKNLFKN